MEELREPSRNISNSNSQELEHSFEFIDVPNRRPIISNTINTEGNDDAEYDLADDGIFFFFL